jgi:hypothetical protein
MYDMYRWPNGVIPYELSSDYENGINMFIYY